MIIDFNIVICLHPYFFLFFSTMILTHKSQRSFRCVVGHMRENAGRTWEDPTHINYRNLWTDLP